MTAITVVTVTLNDLAGLRKTIESVEGQTHLGDVQWVIVDGGSTDGTVAFLERRIWSRIIPTILLGPDDGINDAMTRGAAVGNGHLNFLNSGDRYACPTVLERAVKMATIDVPWFYGQAVTIAQDGRPARPLIGRKYTVIGHAYHRVRVSHQAAFISQDLFRALGGYRAWTGNALDFDLLLRAGQQTQPVVVPDIWIEYLAGGISERRHWRQLQLIHLIRCDVFGFGRILRWVDSIFTALFWFRSRVRSKIKALASWLGMVHLVALWNGRRVVRMR